MWGEGAAFWAVTGDISGVLGKSDSIMANKPAVEGTGEQIEWLKANTECARIRRPPPAPAPVRTVKKLRAREAESKTCG